MSVHDSDDASTTSSRMTSSRGDSGWGGRRSWDEEERGHPDGRRSSISSEKIISSSSTTTKRMSDEDFGDFGTFPRRGVSRGRIRDDLFRDDFDERMEHMVREFDERCARSILEDDVRPFGTFPRRGTEDSVFSRPRLLGNSFFNNSRLRSIFDDDMDSDWSARRWPRALDEDSGVFSDVTIKSRNDGMQLDKTLRQDRRCTPEKFQVEIDVKGFNANELLVKTEGNRLVITAKSKEVDGVTSGKISSRELKREFDLPEGVDPYDVVSNLMPDGFLRVEAPVKLSGSGERRHSSSTECSERRLSSGTEKSEQKET